MTNDFMTTLVKATREEASARREANAARRRHRKAQAHLHGILSYLSAGWEEGDSQ